MPKHDQHPDPRQSAQQEEEAQDKELLDDLGSDEGEDIQGGARTTADGRWDARY